MTTNWLKSNHWYDSREEDVLDSREENALDTFWIQRLILKKRVAWQGIGILEKPCI